MFFFSCLKVPSDAACSSNTKLSQGRYVQVLVSFYLYTFLFVWFWRSIIGLYFWWVLSQAFRKDGNHESPVVLHASDKWCKHEINPVSKSIVQTFPQWYCLLVSSSGFGVTKYNFLSSFQSKSFVWYGRRCVMKQINIHTHYTLFHAHHFALSTRK